MFEWLLYARQYIINCYAQNINEIGLQFPNQPYLSTDRRSFNKANKFVTQSVLHSITTQPHPPKNPYIPSCFFNMKTKSNVLFYFGITYYE